MKKFIHIACLFLMVGVLSCNDKDEISDSDQLPGWLQLKITELTPGPNDCEIRDLTLIVYKGKKYYHIYNGLWSCIYCQLFDESSNRPDWNQEEWNDFAMNKKEIRRVKACE